jgi:predicted MFS family arabinose efflux permease
MLDLSLFRNLTFTGANTAMLLVGLAMFGIFFYVSLFVQQVLRYSPVQAGATFLPMTLLVILVAPQAGRAADRFGSRWLVGTGLTLMAISLLLYTRVNVGSTFWNLLPALIVGGFGMSLAMAPTTAAAMSAVSVDKAGVGSAVLNSMRQVGGSLGIAIMGAVVAQSTGHSDRPSPQAFTTGFHHAVELGAVFALVGAAVAVTTIRQPEHARPAAVAERI